MKIIIFIAISFTIYVKFAVDAALTKFSLDDDVTRVDVDVKNV
jgi:hypothetical protein